MRSSFLKLIVLSILFISCSKQEFAVSNLNNNKIGIIGHGGMGISHVYPMNTYESVIKSLNLGAHGVEVDVQMTADGILVAFHEHELSDLTNANGQIYNQTWEEISEATYLRPVFAEYSIIRMDKLLSGLQDPEEIIIVLDCKNFDPDSSEEYYNKFTDALTDLLNKFGLGEKVYIEFKRTGLISAIRDKREDLKVFINNDDFHKALDIALEYDLHGMVMAVGDVSEDQVLAAHANGFMVAVYNIHSRSSTQEAIRKNVDYIQTDRLRYLLKILD